MIVLDGSFARAQGSARPMRDGASAGVAVEARRRRAESGKTRIIRIG
jgi:hypothetical protein